MINYFLYYDKSNQNMFVIANSVTLPLKWLINKKVSTLKNFLFILEIATFVQHLLTESSNFSSLRSRFCKFKIYCQCLFGEIDANWEVVVRSVPNKLCPWEFTGKHLCWSIFLIKCTAHMSGVVWMAWMTWSKTYPLNYKW